MSIKVKKYSILIIAAVLLVAMAFAGAASAETKEIWTIDDWKTNMTGSNDCVLMDNLDFTGEPVNCATITSFSGTLDGKYHTISNFSISSTSNNIGLIGSYSGTKIGNLTLSNFSVSGKDCVGGLVGYAEYHYHISMHIENVHVEYGKVSGGYDAGGLVGRASSSSTSVTNCSSESCVIASLYTTGAGGLIGETTNASFDICKVVNSSISGYNHVGGLLGHTLYASNSPFMNGSSVMNCIISAGSYNVGGLVGYAWTATGNGTTGCAVENCTIAGSHFVGGLVGRSYPASCVFNTVNWVNDSAVRGTSTNYIGEVVGIDHGSEVKNIADYSSTGNVSSDGSIWVNMDSNVNYPKIYIAKDSAKQGPENSTYFNNGLTASSVPSGAKLVTQLTGYGPNGQYAAFTYVFEAPKPTLYEITITNATGTYQLTSAMTKVYGDYGTGNGTAVLTFDSESKPVLTLNGFKASNMSGMPIINASVPDLTIVLKGESKLTGSYADNDDEGLLYSSGNLTIKGANDSSKLLVNNTRSGSSAASPISVVQGITNDNANVTAIHVVNDLMIDNAKVTVLTGTTGSSDVYGLRCDDNLTITGSKTVVEANVICTSGKSSAIYAYHDITIESAKKVNATAGAVGSLTSTAARGLYAADGSITITDSDDVTATAIVPNSAHGGAAISIWASYPYDNNINYNGVTAQGSGNAAAKSDIVISNSKVTAKAEGGEEAHALGSYGDITITGDKTVIDAEATGAGSSSTSAGFAISAVQNLTINSAKKIKAVGSSTSVGYYGSLNLSAVADYKFSNASVEGAEPKSYATFVNSSNWHEFELTVSNYTAVLIEKKSTTPSSTGSSSSKQTGYTVILQDTVVPADAADTLYTVNFIMNGHGIQVMNQSVSFGNTADEPSPVPTADGYTFTGWYTDKGLVSKYAFSTPVTDDVELYAGWTAKPSQTSTTSKSPAPFLGLIAGLGAAALVLGRLRR